MLLLVDGSSVAVTLFYALGGNSFLEEDSFATQEEISTFLSTVAETTLGNIERRVRLDRYSEVRIALESPRWAPVWRYEVYPSYKYADTQKKPRVAQALQPFLIKAADSLGIRTVFAPKMEADDVLASMVEKLGNRISEMEVHIWSQDKDLHQLITHDNLKIIGKAGEVTTKEDIETLWGAPATAIPMIKALAGDKSDNIPGVRGIGPKTASKLLTPKPHRKPSPFTIDLEKVPEDRRRQIQSLMPRIIRDEIICTLCRDGKLLSSIHYEGELHGKER